MLLFSVGETENEKLRGIQACEAKGGRCADTRCPEGSVEIKVCYYLSPCCEPTK
ncbi:Hypothetical predicted protein [Podarcis lilfordi]|uniref:Beta-defensin n=1 Tax=Podarcis lilfordi TaxID=74358 RepID=A0AA35K5R0_9SAUR|nr:Hypothetical predicted protein [Podarcis lilfordi]